MRGEIRIRKGGEVDGFEAGSFGTLYVGKVGAGEEGVAGVADVGFPGKIIISIGIANALGSIQGNVTARVPFPEDEICRQHCCRHIFRWGIPYTELSAHLPDAIDALPSNEIPIGEYIFDAIGNKLIRGSHVIELSRIEAMILLFLINHKGITMRSSELMEVVWQHDDYYNRNSLHGYIHKLRKHLRHDPNVSIINLRGIGYRLAVTT